MKLINCANCGLVYNWEVYDGTNELDSRIECIWNGSFHEAHIPCHCGYKIGLSIEVHPENLE
jgi:hypothetical protein